MNKITSSLLVVLGATLIGSLPAPAASPHPSPGSGSVSSSPVLLGGYSSLCNPNGGSAVAESRNVMVGSHNQQVAHIQAQNFSTATVHLQNLNSTTVKQGIYFTLVSGTGDYLSTIVDYIPHGSSNQQSIVFLTPNSKIPYPGNPPRLFSNGNGVFLIPVDNHNTGQGIPVNAKLVDVVFGQLGAERDCTVQTSEINNVILNSRAVGIDHSSSSSRCTEDCTSVGQ